MINSHTKRKKQNFSCCSHVYWNIGLWSTVLLLNIYSNIWIWSVHMALLSDPLKYFCFCNIIVFNLRFNNKFQSVYDNWPENASISHIHAMFKCFSLLILQFKDCDAFKMSSLKECKTIFYPVPKQYVMTHCTVQKHMQSRT